MNDDIIYEYHELANCFPMLEGERRESLKASIKENGVRVPIVIYKEQNKYKIIDGRNRYELARELDVTCPFVEYKGNDPARYVLDLNCERRDLTVSQRAMAATKIANIENGHNQYRAKVGASADAPTPTPVTRDEAAKKLGVGRASIDRARKIEREATPEVVEAVSKGEMPLNTALKTLTPSNVVQLPVEKQEPLTKKQAEVQNTKEYRKLLAEHNKLRLNYSFMEGQVRDLTEENKRLKEELASYKVAK